MSIAGEPQPTFATSPTIELIACALAKAQAAFTPIVKDQKAKVTSKTGASYDYSYAGLPDVIAAVRPALNAQGITILQPIIPYGDGPAIHTLLTHESGQWISSTCPFGMPAGTPQQQGSAVTYWRRYSLQAMLSIACEDDDGAAASTHQAPATRREAAPRQPQTRPAISPSPRNSQHTTPPPATDDPRAHRTYKDWLTGRVTAANDAWHVAQVIDGTPENERGELTNIHRATQGIVTLAIDQEYIDGNSIVKDTDRNTRDVAKVKGAAEWLFSNEPRALETLWQQYIQNRRERIHATAGLPEPQAPSNN